MKKRAILPNIITGLNLLFGIFSLMLTFNEDYIPASICIFIAMICDLLDGQIARHQNATSQFGVEFDSLSDLVSFGIAPGMLAFSFYLHSFDELGVFIVSAYMLTCAIRLARFNVQTKPGAKKVFSGLPSPAAAGLVASSIVLVAQYESSIFMKLFPVTVLVASILMVSTIKYPVPIGFVYFIKNRVTGWPRIILLGILVVLLFTHTELFLNGVFTLYALFGLVRSILLARPQHIPLKAFIKSHKHRNRSQGE